jgi:hypothetical protein
VVAPSSQSLSGERGNLVVAELGPDVCEVPTSGISNRVWRPALSRRKQGFAPRERK